MKSKTINYMLCFASQFLSSSGLLCYECGFLSVIPDSEDQCSRVSHCALDTCNLDLTMRNDNSTEEESGMRAVCFTLSGKFRGEDIMMRGCEVVDDHDQNCLPNFSLWFDTEKGREYVTEHSFCTCTGHLCNGPHDDSGRSSTLAPFWIPFVTFNLFLMLL